LPDRADYAIVDAAVELAKKMGGSRTHGFVNALLRNVGRNIKNRSTPLANAEVAKTVVQNPTMGCEFIAAILPDPKDNPTDYLSTLFSLPQWLIEEWLGEFGFEQAKSICLASNRRPGVYLRSNALKTTPQQLYELLRSSGIDCKLIAERGMIKVNQPGDITKLPGFDGGLFVVQDLTASEAVKMLSPQPEQAVLDMCAAPGTKTTQLAELMADTGTVFATDIDEMRLKRVETACNRLQMSSIRTLPFANLSKSLANETYDAVLLDVPCSNTGVLARRPEVRYRIQPSAIAELARTQLELLACAADIVKSGGKICYSTCSIQKQETTAIVRQFFTEKTGFTLLQEKLLLPSAGEIDCDGGYTAILQRK
jgi:16S rRNA (cytosine967-C5)-methyltransferase